MNKCVLAIMVVVMGVGGSAEGNWVTLDYPGAASTTAHGIDGGKVVGSYADASGVSHGFLYEAGTWTTLDLPEAEWTEAWGIDGQKVVGYSPASNGVHGFVYDGTDWNAISYGSDMYGTYVTDIDNDIVVGYTMYATGDTSGFVYDGSTWTEIRPDGGGGPGSHPSVYVYGIDGGNIVGGGAYIDSHGFLYNGTSYSEMRFPEALNTMPYGIDGDNIVGGTAYNGGSHGFLYDGVTWTTLDFPGATYTEAYGIDGLNIVGSYEDASGTHGFIYIIPEPTTLLLLGAGSLAVRRRRRY